MGLQTKSCSYIQAGYQTGSVNPTAIVAPAILATTVSTLAAIVFCKMMAGKSA